MNSLTMHLLEIFIKYVLVICFRKTHSKFTLTKLITIDGDVNMETNPYITVRATAGQAARTSGRAQTSRGSEGLVYYEIMDYIINAPSRGSEEERMGIPCW